MARKQGKFAHYTLDHQTLRTGGGGRAPLALCTADAVDCAIRYKSSTEQPEAAMAKGQMRSNKEKKKPKQDKNKKKGPEAPSPFAGMHSQAKPGSSYASQYGKKQ